MKMAKRILALLLVFVTVCSLIPGVASAVSINGFDCVSDSKYARTYALSNSGHTIPYTSTSLKTRGHKNSRNDYAYIDNASDEIYILDVGSTDGKDWARVSYPSGKKRVQAYVFLSDLTSSNGSHQTFTSTGRFNCSLRSYTGNSSNYYVAKGDKVTHIATKDSKYQILYNAGSVYRLAWCDKSDFEKYCGKVASNDMVDVTAQFAGKEITLKSVQNGKYLCADGNLSNTPAVCDRSTASKWEKFTVSSLTSDGWVGLKAKTNGKWLCANKNISNTPVQALADKLQAWECFRIYQKGNNYYIKAQANSKWLSVRVNTKGSPVQAYVSTASAWERFEIRVIDNKSETPITETVAYYWPCSTAYYVTCLCYRASGQQHLGQWPYTNIIDIGGGGDIVAIKDGTVAAAGNVGDWKGNYIIITHNDGTQSLYAHLDSYKVKAKDSVKGGQVIGVMGNTGNSNGTHLHFEYSGGNLWDSYYKTAYKSKLSYQQNVYSNNEKKRTKDSNSQNVVDWLSNGYIKRGDYYYYSG